jgi:outer membrane protein assembly factor BamB
MASKIWVVLIIVLIFAASASAGIDDWPHYGRTANRCSIAVDGPNEINSTTLAWEAWEDPCYPGYEISFEAATGAVVYSGRVFAYAKYFEPNESYPDEFDYVASQLMAFDANDGSFEWLRIIDQAIWDSWSSPCVDTKNNSVLIGSGDKVYCFDCNSGEARWTRQLDNSVINASICVAQDIAYARAFITDYSGYFSAAGKLYCINLDANSIQNPYNPGDVVWSDVIGSTSGNTPAYKDGVVYVTTLTDPNHTWIEGDPNSGGMVYAYDADATTATKLWGTLDPNFEGFCGGLTVTKAGYLYAANYDFYDKEDNSILCKIDCTNGAIVWKTLVERTEMMPVVVGDKIYISGGYDDAMSRPKVEAYQDFGTSVTKLWETPASMRVGYWTAQPVYAAGKLYVGCVPADNMFGAADTLYILDVNTTPADPNFIIDQFDGCGNSPAVTYDSLYSIGANSLFKFHQPALLADVIKNGAVDNFDLKEFTNQWLYDGAVGMMRCDMDLDGDVDFYDYVYLADEWGQQLD